MRVEQVDETGDIADSEAPADQVIQQRSRRKTAPTTAPTTATTTARFGAFEDWRPLEAYHPVLRLIAQWCWDQAARGLPPPSLGGFALRVGVSRKLMRQWALTGPDGRLPGFTVACAYQIAEYTHLPLQTFLMAGGQLTAETPIYTQWEAYQHVAEQLTQLAQHDPGALPFDPAPVLAWLAQQTGR